MKGTRFCWWIYPRSVEKIHTFSTHETPEQKVWLVGYPARSNPLSKDRCNCLPVWDGARGSCGISQHCGGITAPASTLVWVSQMIQLSALPLHQHLDQWIDVIIVFNVKTICHARDLCKLARSCKHLRLLCPSDPCNLQGTDLNRRNRVSYDIYDIFLSYTLRIYQ